MYFVGPIHPSSSTSRHHVDDEPSNKDNETRKKQGKIKFPCRLCEGNHLIHLCPYMDEASKVLDTLSAYDSSLPIGYRKFSSSPLLVDQVIDRDSSPVNSTLSESQSPESISGQSLVEKKVDLILPTVHQVFSIESGPHLSQVLLVSSASPGPESGPPISMIQEGDPPTPITTVPEIYPPSLIPGVHEDGILAPITQGDKPLIPMAPPPCILVTSFDWSRFMRYHLPAYVPFDITI